MIYKNTVPMQNRLGFGKRFATIISGAILTIVLFALPTLTWSQAKTDPATVKVNVGVSTAKPGDIIDIPLTLSLPDTSKVTAISETIAFPKKALTLTKGEVGLAGEQSEAQITTDVKDDPADAANSLLSVTVSAKGALKPGILAYLKFKVSEQAAKSTVVLKLTDSKATPQGGEAMATAKGKDGEVTIFNTNEEIPVVGCFFFSH